jgi:hypothetical protein
VIVTWRKQSRSLPDPECMGIGSSWYMCVVAIVHQSQHGGEVFSQQTPPTASLKADVIFSNTSRDHITLLTRTMTNMC